MKFLVDAQLPRSLALWLQVAGYDATQTLDLPEGNRTPDRQINLLAARDGCIVVTKDSDFVNSHLLSSLPPRLLLISTGNLRNQELIGLFSMSIELIQQGFESFHFIEMTANRLIFHG